MNLFQCWTLAALLAIGPALAHAPAPKAAATLDTIISVLAHPMGASMDAEVPSAKWAAIARFPGIKSRTRDLLINTDPTWNRGNTTIQVSPVDESGEWAC